MRVLLACEESQAVCKEFRTLGHEAYSCDLYECSGGHPEWHIKGDCLPILNGRCEFTTENGDKHIIDTKWDLIIAFPPCTHLTCTGQWAYTRGYKDPALKEEGANFFMQMINADCDMIAVENPVGIMSTRYRKPDQIIQPYMFGDEAQKTTCLWLKGLPLLTPTKIVGKGEKKEWVNSKGQKKAYPKWIFDALNKARTKEERSKLRSKTFLGIAKAMAKQWGEQDGDMR